MTGLLGRQATLALLVPPDGGRSRTATQEVRGPRRRYRLPLDERPGLPPFLCLRSRPRVRPPPLPRIVWYASMNARSSGVSLPIRTGGARCLRVRPARTARAGPRWEIGRSHLVGLPGSCRRPYGRRWTDSARTSAWPWQSCQRLRGGLLGWSVPAVDSGKGAVCEERASRRL